MPVGITFWASVNLTKPKGPVMFIFVRNNCTQIL